MSVRKNAMFITKCVGTQCQSYSVEKFVYNFLIAKTFNPLSANPKNDQTHSNNSSAIWRLIV